MTPYALASLQPACHCSQIPCLCPNVHRAAGEPPITPTDDDLAEAALQRLRAVAYGDAALAHGRAPRLLSAWDDELTAIERSPEFKRLNEEESMPRCPRCTRGRLWDDGDRVVCVLCSYVARDEVSLLDKIESNATPEGGVMIGEDRQPGAFLKGMGL